MSATPIDTKIPQVTATVTSPSVDSPDGSKRAELRMTMLKKLRPYPLSHEWEFWHEKDDPDADLVKWDDRLTKTADINTVQSFWQVFNNTPFVGLPIKYSMHLFKKDVKPLWEDPFNVNGGAWTFRVPKDKGLDFWREILMMAIGEILQEVVHVKKGDDICGVSISVRFNSYLIQVWTKDATNEASRQAVLQRIKESLPAELSAPTEGERAFYKKHTDHKGYTAKPTAA
ncbi:translation initiation factor eIF 4e-like domain-containing protein [Pyronema domesticum]|nr:translation initiation factor eIF 4e-like domain-containing protein [Pyronema domesticum]